MSYDTYKYCHPCNFLHFSYKLESSQPNNSFMNKKRKGYFDTQRTGHIIITFITYSGIMKIYSDI